MSVFLDTSIMQENGIEKCLIMGFSQQSLCAITHAILSTR